MGELENVAPHAVAPAAGTRPNQLRVVVGDKLFRLTTGLLALLLVAILFSLTIALVFQALPSIRQFGLAFIVGTVWDPVNDRYGALPFIFGTLVSSALALLVAVPLGIGVALCLSEMAPPWLSRQLGLMVELLAAIPSVVYGLWGIFILGPWLRDYVEPFLEHCLGFLPLFKGPHMAVGMFTAGVLLAIMVLPYIAAVSTEVFRSVPSVNREAALALGATQWEMVQIAVLPYGISGVIGAVILGLGRALGETIAVAMVIGNRPEISSSLFQPSATLASVIANQFGEAMSDLNVAALVELSLVLLVMGLVINLAARALVYHTTQRHLGIVL